MLLESSQIKGHKTYSSILCPFQLNIFHWIQAFFLEGEEILSQLSLSILLILFKLINKGNAFVHLLINSCEAGIALLFLIKLPKYSLKICISFYAIYKKYKSSIFTLCWLLKIDDSFLKSKNAWCLSLHLDWKVSQSFL